VLSPRHSQTVPTWHTLISLKTTSQVLFLLE
jgi:hypothetical protein